MRVRLDSATWRLAGAGLLAAIIVGSFPALWLVAGDRTGGLVDGSLRFEGGDMRLLEGEGEVVGTSLRIDAMGGRGLVILAATLAGTATDVSHLERFELQLDGGPPESIRLFWAAPGRGSIEHIHPLETDAAVSGVELSEVPEWPSRVRLVGVVMDGPALVGSHVEALVFHPSRDGVLDLYRDLFAGWSEVRVFTHSTINVVPGSARPVIVDVTLALVAWVVGTVILFAVMSRGRARALAVLTVVVMAWLVLDLRWQRDLLHEHRATWEKHRPQPEEERIFSDFGGAALLEMIASADTALQPSARVFVVSPHEALRTYAGYRLLPKSSYHDEELVPAVLRHADVGDGLLLLAQTNARPLSFRRGLSAADRARLPIEWGVDDIDAPGSRRVGASLGGVPRVVLGFSEDAEGNAAVVSENALAAGLYQAVVRMQSDTWPGGHAALLQVFDAGGDHSTLLAERRFRIDGEGWQDLKLGFGLPERSRITVRVEDMPPGARLEHFRIQVPADTRNWALITREGEPPYRAARLLDRGPLGMLFEFQ